MQLSIPHKLSKTEAKVQIQKFIDEAGGKAAEQGVTLNDVHWEDDTLHFDVSGQGQRFSGTVTVLEGKYDIYVKLPLMMRMFEGRIKKMIEDQTQTALKQAGQ